VRRRTNHPAAVCSSSLAPRAALRVVKFKPPGAAVKGHRQGRSRGANGAAREGRPHRRTTGQRPSRPDSRAFPRRSRSPMRGRERSAVNARELRRGTSLDPTKNSCSASQRRLDSSAEPLRGCSPCVAVPLRPDAVPQSKPLSSLYCRVHSPPRTEQPCRLGDDSCAYRHHL
jgi:hypothetical protein